MEGIRAVGGGGLNGSHKKEELIHLERLKALVYGQSEILEMMSSGASLFQILSAIASWVESQSNNELLASILIMDKSGTRLLHGAAPGLPNAYNDAVNGILIGPEVGTCGAAAYL